ncbi:class I SAM-dependent methyltransferase [Saccharopolyspora karakumensis]|uniref:Class I SAM-dependent methyltransferase n=1 Tax=Saccharopolyspora karakumensis TaxID=2530386 RepID=A0A4R5BL23_9PSEU|nr:class I SAM-dependent methyltransferase [Saccharopolyspora karakumensis]TDD84554.1 class I SAM-dependent methyltransferase [Saccharopolyspora karakumensis]
MTAAIDHYDRLLAAHYTWMLGGDIEALATAQTELLRDLGLAVAPGEHATAVDLGCGPGPQTLALARLGYSSVAAVDTSAALLDELQQHARHDCTTTIQPVHDDIRGVLPRITEPDSTTAIACMGDTLPHLPTHTDVRELNTDVATSLRPGGSFVATYRDLTHELHGPDRFIPVRSSPDRVLTCFLDFIDENTAQIHDLLYTQDNNTWNLQVDSYPKLRISPQALGDQCNTAGLDIRHHETSPNGMRVLHAQKP